MNAAGQIEDETAIHFRIEGEVEAVERAVDVAETGLFAAPVQQTVGASREFIGNQTGDQIDGWHRFSLSLA